MPERYRGRADLPLTPLGEAQARATAEEISAHWRPAAIYASPLRRCVVTAEAIARAVGVEPRYERDLIDIDYGEWQGLSPDEARERWPAEVDLWHRAPQAALIPGGETLGDVQARAVRTLGRVVRAHPDTEIVVVAHDTVNRVLLLHAMELPLSRYWHIKQDPCSLDVLAFTGDADAVVHGINETRHLRGM